MMSNLILIKIKTSRSAEFFLKVIRLTILYLFFLELFVRLMCPDYRAEEFKMDFMTTEQLYKANNWSNLFFYKLKATPEELFLSEKKNVYFLGASSLSGCYPPYPLYENISQFNGNITVFPDILKTRFKEYPVNFVNLAVCGCGFNSHSILKGLKEFQTYIRPNDIFILYEGFNDQYVSYLDENCKIDVRAGNLNHYVNFLAKYSIFARVIKYNILDFKKYITSLPLERFFENIGSKEKCSFLSGFEENLWEMYRIIDSKKATLVLTTQIANSCLPTFENNYALNNKNLTNCFNATVKSAGIKGRGYFTLPPCVENLPALDKIYYHLLNGKYLQKKGIPGFLEEYKKGDTECISGFYDLPTNQIIRTFSKKHKLELIDFSEYFEKKYSKSTGYLFFVDNIHPNEEAHEILADILMPHMEKLLSSE